MEILDLMSKAEYARVASPTQFTFPDAKTRLTSSISYFDSNKCEEVVKVLEPLRSNNYALR